MAFPTTVVKPLLFALALVHIFVSGNAYEEGKGFAGYDPFTGSSQPYTGSGAATIWEYPAQIIAKALLCFNDKQIYSSCEESYRLTQTGNLEVPPEYVDQYCKGPCLTETHLVLDCLENVVEHFLFYNKATVRDIKDTIKAGCGYGPERGNFDVVEHLQAKENAGYKADIRVFPVFVAFGILANALFL